MLPSSTGNCILFTSPLLKQRHPLRWVATTLVRSNHLQTTEDQLTCALLKHGFFSPKSPLSFHVHVTVRRDHITQWRKTEAYGTKGPLQEMAKMPRLAHKQNICKNMCSYRMPSKQMTKPAKKGRILPSLQLPHFFFHIKFLFLSKWCTKTSNHRHLTMYKQLQSSLFFFFSITSSHIFFTHFAYAYCKFNVTSELQTLSGYTGR